MKTISEVFRELGQMEGMDLFPGASAAEIAAFETANGIALPDGYKSWLVLCDGGELFIPGIQLYGCARKPFIMVNDKDVPEGSIIIGSFSFGDPVCFTSGRETIRSWNHEKGEFDEEWPDFAAFLNDLCESFKESAGE